MKTNKLFFRVALILFSFLSLHLFKSQGNANSFNILSIITPSNGSSVISPISLIVKGQSTDTQLVRVNLFDSNGTRLARQLLPYEYIDGQVISIAFDIPQVESPALLTVDMLDSTFKTQQTRSVQFTLLSIGESNILSKSAEDNWLTINSIETIEEANGNQIKITGRITPITVRPVHFELITETDRIIGSRQLAVLNPGIATSFNILIPFQGGEDPVRLVVRQTITPYQTNAILDSYSLSDYLP